MNRTLACLGCLLAVFSLVWIAEPGAQSGDLLARARALHAQVPLIDGHNDYPWEVRQRAERDLDKLDISRPQPTLMTDIARLKAGGVGGVFWSVYTPGDLAGSSAVTATLEQIDIVHRMLRKWPDAFELALTADDIERIFRTGKVASVIGMEGGHSIDSSLAALRMFHRLGARYLTLTHNRNIPWADAASDAPKLGGLSPFGEAVVREMNWLGMLVDLSHVSPAAMDDALRVSEAPVIFSHSSARALVDVPRNVPDDILRRLSKNGGVVMVDFVTGFISAEVAAHGQKARDERARQQALHPNDATAVTAAMDAWRKANPEPKAMLSQVADHIEYIRKVAGIDHIGIGSDFDGITSTIVGLEDVSTFPALTAELLRRGCSDDDVKKILGLNVLRVMRQAEAAAARLQKTRGPSAALIEQLDKRE